MHNREAFAQGMAALGVNTRIEVTDAQRNLYWTMLGDLSDADFQQAATAALQHSRFFPTIAELRQYVTPYTGSAAEAVLAFERVVKCGNHTPTGTRWSIRRVAEVAGPVAAEAFAAAGASSAFEYEQGERDLPFLRKRFVEAYVAAREAQRKGRQITAGGDPARLPRSNPVRELIRQTVARLPAPTQLVPDGAPRDANPGAEGAA